MTEEQADTIIAQLNTLHEWNQAIVFCLWLIAFFVIVGALVRWR